MKSINTQQQIIEEFNLVDDAFFQKVMEDKGACEEMLRTILEMPTLEIIEVTPQKNLKNLVNRSVILDCFCTDENGAVFCVEMQKYNKGDDYQRRVRYNMSCVDTAVSEKGQSFEMLPDIYNIFIANFDMFGRGKTVYNIDRVLRGSKEIQDNGIHEYYVNALGKDKSEVSELMEYFRNTCGVHSKFPQISKRVKSFKNIETGGRRMGLTIEEIKDLGRAEGIEQGIEQNRIETICNMLQANLSVDLIKAYTKYTDEQIEEAKEELQAQEN